MNRCDDLGRFYSLLDELEVRVGGRRRLSDCTAKTGWPKRGVDFFFEDGEERGGSGTGLRVVRVGTHGVARGSRATLWSRLAAHRGTTSGSGNHRGSVFRLIVGEAIGLRNTCLPASWGRHSSLGAAAKALHVDRDSLRGDELSLERAVSDVIGAMSVLWLEVDEEPGAGSLRSVVERNSIGLLSNAARPAVDAPTAAWLGGHSKRDAVRDSGLWNQDCVRLSHEPSFLRTFERLVLG